MPNPKPTKLAYWYATGSTKDIPLEQTWYKSKQNAIARDLNSALQKFEEYNSESWNRSSTIEKESVDLKMENIDLKAKIVELEQEIADGKAKIAVLEVNGKKCAHCNKLLDIPIYCDKKCHDDRLSQLISQQSQS